MNELPDYRDIYDGLRGRYPLAASLLAPGRFALNAIQEKEYFSPDLAFVTDVISTQMAQDNFNGETRNPRLDRIYHQFLVAQNLWAGCGAPVYFMDAPTTQALMEVPPFEDATIADLYWPTPAFRLFLPKGVLNYRDRDLGWIDVALIHSSSVKAHDGIVMEITGTLPDNFEVQGLGTTLSCSFPELPISNPLGFSRNGLRLPLSQRSIADNMARFAASGGDGDIKETEIVQLALNLLALMKLSPPKVDMGDRKGLVSPEELLIPRFIGQPRGAE